MKAAEGIGLQCRTPQKRFPKNVNAVKGHAFDQIIVGKNLNNCLVCPDANNTKQP
jgi:hypothetical protein